tara:strand:+ start:352 stop:780 length:429 start_codon:yes stop_codon:yes gene_type:complete
MTIWKVTIGFHDNGWDGVMRIFCPTKKIAQEVKEKLKKDFKNGKHPAGFHNNGCENGIFNILKITKVDLGNVGTMGRKELACVALYIGMGGNHSASNSDGGVVGANNWQEILEAPDEKTAAQKEQEAIEKRGADSLAKMFRF